MRSCVPNPRRPRRGVTLLEMLVAVALLVLMMTIVTSIFQAATGAITVAKTYQELDGNLRQLDSVLRQDLEGATVAEIATPAGITPPLNPDLNLGYFEVGENQFADLQGEDSDDYIRFTVRAPDGQPFTGRMWLGPVFLPSPPFPANTPNQPVMIQSQYAEVIYFLRNGNLYRRVFLIAPERQQSVTINGAAGWYPWQFPSAAFGGITVSWQGMNDLSARPSTFPGLPPVLNTVGDLTNRENRAFYPRFSNDYLSAGSPAPPGPDGQWDDVQYLSKNIPGGDTVPDWWPTFYPGVFNLSLINPTQDAGGNSLFYFARYPNTSAANSEFPDLMAFPYVFTGAYSLADPTSAVDGPLHGMGAPGATGNAMSQGQLVTLKSPPAPPNTLPLLPQPYGFVYNNGSIVANSRNSNPTDPTLPLTNPINLPNHNPIATGDTLTTPDMAATPPLQTWWGFPTWKETIAGGTPNTPASPGWGDPVLSPVQSINLFAGGQAPGLSWANRASFLLPPLTDPTLDLQQYNDGAGTAVFTTPASVFRDDVIMQGVRSFDVKVYDNAVPGYVDLGYSNYVDGASATVVSGNAQARMQFARDVLLPTMGHEGRIPPLPDDFRPDPNYIAQVGSDTYWQQFPSGLGDGTTGLVRLRRVWDTWSTDYSNAPATALNVSTNTMIGPPLSPPVYPSYPPPYTASLRGLQIQLRVVDPRNERIKVLTIRHSFSN